MTVATAEMRQRRGGDWGSALMVIISGLLCLGALMVFSAAASLDQRIDLGHFWRYATMRRVAFVPVVWVLLAVVSRLNYRRWLVNEGNFWRSPIVVITALAAVLLVLVLR